MEQNIKISAIIPTCDRMDYLPEAIDSIRAQTLPPTEIIVVNNGKNHLPEGSLGDDVQILNLEPYVGVSAARNAGEDTANGDYLAFLDDDDLWDKDFLKHLANKIESENAACAFGTRVKFFPNGKTKAYKNKLPQKIPTPNSANFYKAPGFGGTNFLVWQKAFFTVGGFDENLKVAEDQDLFVRIVSAGFKVSTAPEAICLVRQHSMPRLRYDSSFGGLQPYYLKHKKKLNVLQHLHFVWRYLVSIRKHVFRLLKLKKT